MRRFLRAALAAAVLATGVATFAGADSALATCPGIVGPIAPGGSRVDACYNESRTDYLDLGAAASFILQTTSFYPSPWYSTTNYAYRKPYDVCAEYTLSQFYVAPGASNYACPGIADTVYTTRQSANRVHVVGFRYYPAWSGHYGTVCSFEGEASGSNARPYLNGADPLPHLDSCQHFG